MTGGIGDLKASFRRPVNQVGSPVSQVLQNRLGFPETKDPFGSGISVFANQPIDVVLLAEAAEPRGNDQQLAAVGELGLDYFYEQSEREVQRSVFAEFLELALQWRRPAIVHIRDKEESSAAYEDAEALLRDFSAAGGSFVVHCFAGTPAEAETFLAMGGYLGVTGMVTFRRAENIREVLKLIPDERLLIETDSPYLAPVPHRGAQNHPGYLGLIAARVAEVRGCSTPELAALTFQNACRFFHCEER